MPILITDQEARGLLHPAALIDAMAEALRDFSSGAVTQPLRPSFSLGAPRDFAAFMPACWPSAPALGLKAVTVCHGNTNLGLETHQAAILLLDPVTGQLQALINGAAITALRTAAVSALSARLLAREDASSLAILGSGVQARSHLALLPLVRPFTDIRVWSPRLAPGDFHGARAVASKQEAVDGASVVVLATSAREPVIEDSDITPGTHVISVGACRPDQREMHPVLLSHARVIVDSRAAALAESGDIIQSIEEGWMTESQIAGELGDIVAGRLPGRLDAHEITLFKSLGLAIEDLAAARLIHRRALETGVGTQFAW